MTTLFTKPVLSLLCCAALAACGGAPQVNELRFNVDGQGRFSGSAGAAWTEAEIKAQASGQFCRNRPIGQFNVSVLPSAPDIKIFDGVCASATTSLITPTSQQSHSITTQAPTQKTQSTQSAGWDGSTPIVD